ncbi:MAG TPA: EAL domain-containing protein, partial [Gemmatimonadaceae bacterium]|nr:EAL domain-containing protein [Gemmatimonadaceae bacterium]
MPEPVPSVKHVLEDRLGKTGERAGAPPSRPATPYDALPEESFDRVARLAAGALRSPVAIVSLLDDDRHVVKSSVGLTGRSRVWRKVPLALRYARQVVSTGRPVFIGNTNEKVLVDSDGDERTPDGVAYAVAPVTTADGQVIGTVCVIDTAAHAWTHTEINCLMDVAASLVIELELRSDLSLKRQTQEHLLFSTLHDALTGLPNRSLFTERLRHAMRRAARHPDNLFAVLFLDLDRFKDVNDNLGHFAGDELLRAVARRLEACLRPEDTVARLSGDEFAILLESITDSSDAGRVAERIEEALSFPINLAGAEVVTSASMGIVTSSMSHDQPEQLLRSADMAMYRAKAAGRARYEMFDRTMHTDALARLQLETDLRRAVELGEFRLHYQPLVSLKTGRVTGLEALVRWEHPSRGLVHPGDFIPIAEETGLIVPMGRWVLDEACRQMHEWHQSHSRAVPLTIGVNLSAKQFSQPDMVDQIAGALATSGIDPHSLRIEITESAIIDKGKSADLILQQIRDLGVQIYLDDFGTGYSSLSYLHGLPIDAIKIDREFVSNMDTDDKNMRLVRTILTLAEIVGVRAEAEGISTAEQLRELRLLNCEQGQGYLFSAPITKEAVDEV